MAAFENRQTEPKPNRITNDEDKYKSSIVKVQPGLLPNSEQKDENIFVTPAIANAPVSGSFSLVNSIRNVHNETLVLALNKNCPLLNY